MQKLGVWQVTGDGPVMLRVSQVDLEQHLEAWIERDPALLQAGLRIVGRQVTVEGGRLDLLALDTQGRWVIIEIKAGFVRRETVAQALDYASSVATMPLEVLAEKLQPYLEGQSVSLETLLRERGAEETVSTGREVQIFIVGTGKDAGLERMVRFLGESYGVPITVVLFDVFELPDGQRILTRELTEADAPQDSAPGPRASRTMEQFRAQAAQVGVVDTLQLLLNHADRYGMVPRPYRRSIMFTPPTHRNRMVFTLRLPDSAGETTRVYTSAEALSEFYPVTTEAARGALGDDGWHPLSYQQAQRFVAVLDDLLTTDTDADGQES